VTEVHTVFTEATAERRVAAVPLSHISIEVGHLYAEDFALGREYLRDQFDQVRPWVDAARLAWADNTPRLKSRVSTCFMVDDYFTPFSSPAAVLPELIDAARDAGVDIDYLVRESGCAEADGVSLARLVEGRLVADPPPGTNGMRPPTTETGWLCNGQRSTNAEAAEAMSIAPTWRPPVQNGARNHSIFVDVELWDERTDRRRWSCSFLATVWQLLRLGLLRNHGQRVAPPRLWAGDFPEEWDELPAIIQLRSTAAPFSAYETLSVLGSRFLPVELAVRTILGQVAIDIDIMDQVSDRSNAEGIRLRRQVVERVSYVFLPGRPTE
jgi:hypothetical protein